MPYTRRYFMLTMNGGDMPLSLYGIGTPKLMISSDSNNLGTIYVGNVFEQGDGVAVRTLDASNNKNTILPGREVEYADTEQYDRLPRVRNFFIENNRRHILSQWAVRGTVGDIVFVYWDDEGDTILNTNGTTIDTSTGGLSR